MKNHRKLQPEQSHPAQPFCFVKQMAHVMEHAVPETLNRGFYSVGPEMGDAAYYRPDSGQIAEIAQAFIDSAPGQFIELLEGRGLASLPFKIFYFDVVKPLMAMLGDMWCEDTAGLLAVSIATERLRLAVDILYPDDDFRVHAKAKCVLVTCFDAAQHNFGSFLLAKAFSASNWIVDTHDWNSHSSAPVKLIKTTHYDLCALSIGAPFDIAAVKAAIANLRQNSSNSGLIIAVGGVGPSLEPEAFADCGADFMAGDAFDAVAKAEAEATKRMVS